MTPVRASVITALHAVPGDPGLGVFALGQDSHVQGLIPGHTQRNPSDHPAGSQLLSSPRGCSFLYFPPCVPGEWKSSLVSHSEYLLSRRGGSLCARRTPQLALSHCNGSCIQARHSGLKCPPLQSCGSCFCGAPLALWVCD